MPPRDERGRIGSYAERRGGDERVLMARQTTDLRHVRLGDWAHVGSGASELPC